MKKNLIVLALFLFAATHSFAFERNKFGLGVVAGDPNGITAKYMIDNNYGIDATVGWKTSGEDEFYVAADFLLHLYDIVNIPKGVSPLYFGGGLRLVDREDTENKFGIRVPFGIEYVFLNGSLGAFGELVPILNFTPDVESDFEFGIGIRYFF